MNPIDMIASPLIERDYSAPRYDDTLRRARERYDRKSKVRIRHGRFKANAKWSVCKGGAN